MIFLQDEQNINAVFSNIKFMCIRLRPWNGSMNLAFIPGFKHYTHRLDILRDCTNIVFISSRSNVCSSCSNCNSFSEARVTRSLVFYVCFVDCCLSFYPV